MSKINKLLEWAVKKPLLSHKLSSLSKAIEKVLNAHRLANLENFVDAKIAAMTQDETESTVMRILALNTIHANMLLDSMNEKVDPFYQETLAAIALYASQTLYRGLSGIVGFQPITGPVGQVFSLQYTARGVTPDGDNRLMLEISSHAVEVRTRKLQASWDIAAADDLLTLYGSDVRDEIAKAVGDEVAYEIIMEVLHIITSKSKTEYFENREEIPDFNDIQQLVIKIITLTNDIARDTRRGAGNVLIVNPVTLTLLQATPGIPFAPVEALTKPNYILSLVGTLNETIKVYVSAFLDTETTIIGYKGNNGESDTGLIYAPYIPIIGSGTVVDPESFNPKIGFITRYGYHIPESSICEKMDYYRVIKIK